MRGIRGAITVGRNNREEIWQAASVNSCASTPSLPATSARRSSAQPRISRRHFPRQGYGGLQDSILSRSLMHANAPLKAVSPAASAFSSSSTPMHRRQTSITSTCARQHICGPISKDDEPQKERLHDLCNRSFFISLHSFSHNKKGIRRCPVFSICSALAHPSRNVDDVCSAGARIRLDDIHAALIPCRRDDRRCGTRLRLRCSRLCGSLGSRCAHSRHREPIL